MQRLYAQTCSTTESSGEGFSFPFPCRCPKLSKKLRSLIAMQTHEKEHELCNVFEQVSLLLYFVVAVVVYLCSLAFFYVVLSCASCNVSHRCTKVRGKQADFRISFE